jgi:hypothetical protein
MFEFSFLRTLADHRQAGMRIGGLDQGKSHERILDPMLRFKIPYGQKFRQQGIALPIPKLLRIDHIANDLRLVAMTGKPVTQEHRRHDDGVDHLQPRMHERSPIGKVIVRFTAGIV